jgi:hypothetical protein
MSWIARVQLEGFLLAPAHLDWTPLPSAFVTQDKQTN